jgi:hypothetical protein
VNAFFIFISGDSGIGPAQRDGRGKPSVRGA